MNATDLPERVEVTVRCLCDCACHGGGYCLDAIEEGQPDCAHDCRGTESGVVCDPFIDRDSSLIGPASHAEDADHEGGPRR